jgi:hypothetical protein
MLAGKPAQTSKLIIFFMTNSPIDVQTLEGPRIMWLVLVVKRDMI